MSAPEAGVPHRDAADPRRRRAPLSGSLPAGTLAPRIVAPGIVPAGIVAAGIVVALVAITALVFYQFGSAGRPAAAPTTRPSPSASPSRPPSVAEIYNAVAPSVVFIEAL